VGKEHRLTERRQAIIEALEEAGQLSVSALSQRFGVSEVTIRGDLQALSEQGLIQRVRGGAIITTVLPDLTYEVRMQLNAAQKARIGQMAASMVHDGDTIALDASTTSQAITPYLKNISELTVVTNGLKAAMSLLAHPGIHVILVGGSLRREGLSLTGPLDCGLIPDIHIRIGFFGARGFTLEEGLTDVNIAEVRTKREMVGRCRQVVGVIDASKWGRIATATFASLDHINALITDVEAPQEMLAEVRRRGVDVIIV
jgi:DeoR family transcriptional regulator of aga operon/DeoR family fructose operon transcriptional repressor